MARQAAFLARLLVLIGLTLTCSIHALDVRIEADMSAIIQRPKAVEQHELSGWQNPSAALLVTAKDASAADYLTFLSNLVLDLQFDPNIEQVVSIFSVPASSPDQDLEQALGGKGDAQMVLSAFRQNNMLAQSLLGPDLRTSVIILQGPKEGLEASLKPHLSCDNPNQHCVKGIGMISIEQAITSQLTLENKYLPAITGLVVFAILSFWFRSAKTGFLLLVPPAVGVIWYVGTLAFFGIPLDSFNSLIPSIALTLGLCDMLHIKRAMHHRKATRRDARAAMVHVLPAITFTTLTTAAAFGSLAFEGSEILNRLALCGALGMVCLYGAILLVSDICIAATPAAIAKSDFKRKSLAHLLRLIRATMRSKRVIQFASISFISLAFVVTVLTPVNFQFDENLPDGSVKQGLHVAAKADLALAPVFATIPNITVENARAVLDRLYHQRLSKAQIDPLLRNVTEHNRLIAPIHMPIASDARQMNALMQDVKSRIGPNYQADITGYPVLVADSVTRSIKRLQIVLAISVLLQSAFFAVLYRSARMGLAALVANALPLLLVHALFALTVGSINVAMAVAMIIASGIIVDDTAHLIWNSKQRADKQFSIRQGILATHEPITLTSLVLIISFGLLLSSALPGLFLMGAAIALALIAAWIADLLILPALLKPACRGPDFPRNERDHDQ